jgi:hypothetical protein
MKRTLTILILFFVTTTYFSQEKTKVEEVGINLYNFQNYGVHYKIGDGTSMWRFRLMHRRINIESDRITIPENKSFNLSLAIGREKRTELAPSFYFVKGLELFSYYTYQGKYWLSSSNTSNINIGVGVSGIVGFRYSINDKFYAGAELLPSIIYNTNKYSGQSVSNLNLSFGSSALLSFGFNF